jgi:hypothetical protein
MGSLNCGILQWRADSKVPLTPNVVNMHKHFAAAVVRLNETYSICLVKPCELTGSHFCSPEPHPEATQ